jgi:ribosome-binding protein aMBF1 (putative translation factor)
MPIEAETMAKVKTSTRPTLPSPVDEGPVGTPVLEDIERHRRESEAYRDESERVAAYEAIARLAVSRRGELGLTQAEVASRMDSTASVVSRIESGRHSVTARTLKRLFEALGGKLLIGAEYDDNDGVKRDWNVV